MKVYFDDNGALRVDAEDNTEMMALERWEGLAEAGVQRFLVDTEAHQQARLMETMKGSDIHD